MNVFPGGIKDAESEIELHLENQAQLELNLALQGHVTPAAFSLWADQRCPQSRHFDSSSSSGSDSSRSSALPLCCRISALPPSLSGVWGDAFSYQASSASIQIEIFFLRILFKLLKSCEITIFEYVMGDNL